MDNLDAAVIAEVTFEFDEKLLNAIETALKPESESPSSERSKIEVMIKGDKLIIKTVASDTTALRAALNSYLRWVEGIQNIVLSI